MKWSSRVAAAHAASPVCTAANAQGVPLPLAGPATASVGTLRGRITGVDAARGVAMMLVCLSHIRVHIVESAPALYALITDITRLGTPSFLLLSGFVAAHLLSDSANRTARAALIDRGLFLLLIAHLLIGLDDLRAASLSEWLFARVLVTDAIGVCLLAAVLVRGFAPRTLCLLGAALILLAWQLAITLSFDSTAAGHVGAVLVHLRSAPSGLVDAALVPYLGVFLIGMALRKWAAQHIESGDAVALARMLLCAGVAAIGCAAALAAAWYATKHLGLRPTAATTTELLRLTVNPRLKLPPSPAYLLAYGGGGLLIAGFCILDRVSIVRGAIRRAAVIGQASLMSFILQDWLLRLAPVVFAFDDVVSPTFWLAYFAAAAVALYWAAKTWRAARGNRFLTVGVKRMSSRRHRCDSAA